MVLAPLVVLTHAPVIESARRDMRAARTLVLLLARGERRDYLAEFRVARTLTNGGRLDTRMTEARRGRAFLTRGGGNLTVELPTKSIDCEYVDEQPSCQEEPTHAALPASEVLAVAIGAGGYDAVETQGATIAAAHARCFHLAATPHHALSSLGSASDLCVTADGLVVRTRVHRADYTEERVATQLRRSIDERALDPLLAGFQSAAPSVGR